MQEQTRRILTKCVGWIGEYLDGDLELRTLVGYLEGSLHALEEKLPASFYDKWYEHWGGLEEVDALSSPDLPLKHTSRDAAAESARALSTPA